MSRIFVCTSRTAWVFSVIFLACVGDDGTHQGATNDSTVGIDSTPGEGDLSETPDDMYTEDGFRSLPRDAITLDTRSDLPGGFGAGCDSDDDCLSQKCVESHVGSVCSSLCVDSCPPGWECAQDPTAVGVVSYVCFPRFQKLCFPCLSNSDCVGGSSTGGHKCVSFGPEGSFCGGDCSDAECPIGFSCTQVTDALGVAASQCIPTNGECPCSAPAIAASASTLCYKQSVYGKCTGTRICTDRGLLACDATEPTLDECDGQDNNCDGVKDEAFSPQGCDKVTEFGICKGQTECTSEGVVCTAPQPSVEVCDGVDNDCDGTVDEPNAVGCVQVYPDEDGDGVGAGQSACYCTPPEEGFAVATGDCDDGNSTRYPGAAESCNGQDDNCSGSVDEAGSIGCVDYFADADGDGYGVSNSSVCLCAETELFSAVIDGDCNDAAAGIHPGIPEECNGKDDDCDGEVDPISALGCTDYFRDEDGDGFGQADDSVCGCGPKYPYTAVKISDCDDTSPSVFPGQVELCNNQDDDCDGEIDGNTALGCTEWYKDLDQDGQGQTDGVSCLCAPDEVYSAWVGGDCNDLDPLIFSGQVETCNGVDDDCDGQVDESGSLGCSTYFRDDDNDGFGVVTDVSCGCTSTPPFTATEAGDCDDQDPDVSPVATESCNGQDDDCDLAVDETDAVGCAILLLDADGDGVGVAGVGLCLCKPTGDYSATVDGDCQDDDAQVFPASIEKCNGKDDNCDGVTDGPDSIGCKYYFVDADGDGFGGQLPPQCLCAKTESLSIKGGDCNDGSAVVSPISLEVCNGVDDNCDSVVDEGCGTPVLGWPTYGFDARRTGHNIQEQGPQTANLKWSVTFADPITTPVLIHYESKRVVAIAKNFVTAFALDGKELWKTSLDVPVIGNGGATLRLGGTMMVVAGDKLVMLGADGATLWSAPLSGATATSPLVDGTGATYVISPSAVSKISAAGQLLWTVEGGGNWSQTAHPAFAPNGLVIGATQDGAIRGINPETGELVWSVSGGQAMGDTFLSIGESGSIYAARSAAIGLFTMAGKVGGTGAFVGKPTGLAIFNTGFECCNPLDYILVARDQTNGLVRYGASLGAAVWSKGPIASSPHAVDLDGDIFVGTAAKQLAVLNSAGNSKWTLATTGTVVAQPTIGLGYVFFGDTSGKLYAIGP